MTLIIYCAVLLGYLIPFAASRPSSFNVSYYIIHSFRSYQSKNGIKEFHLYTVCTTKYVFNSSKVVSYTTTGGIPYICMLVLKATPAV